MKIKFTLLFTSLCLISFAGEKTKIGLLAGVDRSTNLMYPSEVLETELPENKSKITFNVNFHLSYQFNRYSGLSIEPGYILKGVKVESMSNTNFHYIQFPLFADIYLTKKLIFSVGAELNYLAAAHIDWGSSSFEYSGGNVASAFNRIELGATSGLSYNIFKNFDIGLRYNHSLSSNSSLLFTDNQGNSAGEYKFYNQYTQFFVRFKI